MMKRRIENLLRRLRHMPFVTALPFFAAGILFFDTRSADRLLLSACVAGCWIASAVFSHGFKARIYMALGLFLFGGAVQTVNGLPPSGGGGCTIYCETDGGDADRSRLRRGVQRTAAERLARLELPSRVSSVASAMVLGDRSRITDSLQRIYARSGAAHVLAVSGLHMGIVFVLADFVFRFMALFRHGQILACGSVLIPAWLYAAAGGWSSGVVRAAVMFSMLQLARLRSSCYSSVNVLAASAFLILACDPRALDDIGFQLSFIAVAAIVTAGKPLFALSHRMPAAVRWLWNTFVIGSVSYAAVAPLLLLRFGKISLAGVFINPLIIMCAGAVIGITVIWLLFPLPSLQPVVEWLLCAFTELQNRAVECMSLCEWMIVELRPSPYAVAAVYAAAIGILTAVWSCKGAGGRSLPVDLRTSDTLI